MPNIETSQNSEKNDTPPIVEMVSYLAEKLEKNPEDMGEAHTITQLLSDLEHFPTVTEKLQEYFTQLGDVVMGRGRALSDESPNRLLENTFGMMRHADRLNPLVETLYSRTGNKEKYIDCNLTLDEERDGVDLQYRDSVHERGGRLGYSPSEVDYTSLGRELVVCTEGKYKGRVLISEISFNILLKEWNKLLVNSIESERSKH